MIIFFVCFTSNQYKSNQISELSAGQLPFFKRPKKEKEMGMSKMGWGGDWKEQKELFNFHSHSQMCCGQDVAFEKLLAK